MLEFPYVEALIERRPIKVRRRVLWGECDPAGVVYTPRFSDYAVAARDWFFLEGLGLRDRPHPARTAISFPARALSFDFTAFLAADDVFDMAVRVADIGVRSFTVEIAADRADGRCAFTARLTSICIDSADSKARELPPAVREALQSYVEEQG